MLFNSFVFILLVSVTTVLYYSRFLAKWQVQILILSSLIFYANNNPALLLLLLISCGINVITSHTVAYGKPRLRKPVATLGVAANLSVLAFFKYSPLIASTLLIPGSELSDFLVSIPLPVGISFYTFQGISLMVDVYKENHFNNREVISPSLKTHASKTIFFISFFPQLVAGPIVKAHDFIPQIKTKYLKDVNWEVCFKNLVLGYFLKMVVADNLKDHTFWIAYPYFQGYSTITLITMLLGYSCQIFADFSGYSLIAIGLAGLFGYKLRDNFNFPYISNSFQEFWKRWHISLSSFLQEYLYIPLGGSRKGKTRTYLNLMITMFLGGLWHGAAWSYAVWGVFHGLALAIERLLKDQIRLPENIIISITQKILVFLFVTMAWLLFKLPEFAHVIEYVKAMVNNTGWSFDVNRCYYISVYASPVFIYHAFYLLKSQPVFFVIRRYQYIAYGIMLFFIVTNSGSPGSFIYFQF